MKSWGKLLVGAAILAMCAGCFRIETLIKLADDGSGKLFVRFLVSESLDTKDDLNAKAEGLAAKLGEGVTFVGSKEIATKGWKGIQSEYHFTDVRKLKIGDVFNDTTDKKDSEDAKEKKSDTELAFLSGAKDGPWRFKYKQGTSNELIAYREPLTKVASDADVDPFAAAGVELGQAPPAVNLGNAFAGAMLRPMLVGAHVSMTVQVDGTITETNAPSRPANTQSVHLLEMDLGKFAESKQFDRAIMESWNIDRLAKEKVPGISALKSSEEIRIRFN